MEPEEDLATIISRIYPHRTQEQIDNMIVLVEETMVGSSKEDKLQTLCLYLEGDNGVDMNALGENVDEEGAVAQLGLDDLAEEGAVGFAQAHVDWEVIFDRLREMIPQASPTYLKKHAKKLAIGPPAAIENFITEALETPDYPTIEDYNREMEEDERLDLYKRDPLDFDKFLGIFPDPEGAFCDPCRPNPLEDENGTDEVDVTYAKIFLYNEFPYIRKKDIDLVFKMKKLHLITCYDMLRRIHHGLKVPREPIPFPDIRNLPLLQEVAFLKHRPILNKYVNYRDATYREFFEEAKRLNLTEFCLICYTELIPEEFYSCLRNCVFCKECIRKYVEDKMADASVKFPCPNQCDSELSIQLIQQAVPEHMFECLLMKIQSEELRQAALEDVESCPFCDYSNVAPKESTIFKCENEECLKESCRLCRHESHVPKRCNEIEYDEDVQRRTFIENMMTEALARTCHSCKKKFVKTTGCNKMTCTCGALMCYLCAQPITGYDHFGANKQCQLFTNDREFDLKRIQEWAEKAKNDLGNVNIKFDPTKGIEQFYQ